MLFEQGVPRFHFALGPANYVAGPAPNSSTRLEDKDNSLQSQWLCIQGSLPTQRTVIKKESFNQVGWSHICSTWILKLAKYLVKANLIKKH